MTEGLIAPTAAVRMATPGRGRQQIHLGLNRARPSGLSAPLSDRGLSLTLYDYAGQRIRRSDSDREETASAGLVEWLSERMSGVLGQDLDSHPVAAIHVAMQATIDSANRRMLWSPVLPEQPTDDGDDVALWAIALCNRKTRALANAGNHPQLRCDALAVQTLFSLYDAGKGSAIVRGDIWAYTSGLRGDGGDAIKLSSGITIQFDDAGNGVATRDGTEPPPPPSNQTRYEAEQATRSNGFRVAKVQRDSPAAAM